MVFTVLFTVRSRLINSSYQGDVIDALSFYQMASGVEEGSSSLPKANSPSRCRGARDTLQQNLSRSLQRSRRRWRSVPRMSLQGAIGNLHPLRRAEAPYSAWRQGLSPAFEFNRFPLLTLLAQGEVLDFWDETWALAITKL